MDVLPGKKTLLFGFALVLLEIIDPLQAALTTHFPGFMESFGVGLIGVLVIIFRFITKGPVVSDQ